MSEFSNVKENEEINVRVIGQRYELNDKYISIIAELLPKKKTYLPKSINPKSINPKSINRKPRLVLVDN